jgi:NAD(P)-dependent dehydrogenase (short-subunit alcohol dehydrogenase family)
MTDRLGGKVIVVAGAGGIGSGLARRYAADGAAVVLGDIDEASAQTTAKQVAQDGGRIIATRLDGADEASVAAIVALALGEFGGIDGFHANFASFQEGERDILDLPLDIFDEMIRINLRGFVLCTRHALPPMIARGGGAMLYTSSASSFAGLPNRPAYAMSKVAGHALMRHVAARFGPDGIRANALTPGIVVPPEAEDKVPPEFLQSMRDATPLRRLGTPEDVGGVAAFLMSDDGAYVTGQLISIDGGRTMRQ